MRWKTFIIGWSLAFVALLFAQHRAPVSQPQTLFSSVVDLTHTVDAHSPAASQGAFSGVITVDKNGFAERGIRVPQHFATTIQSPAAALAGHWTVDQIPTDHLLGPLVVLDVTHKASATRDYQVSLDDIALWEDVNGPVPPGAIVIARTGWEVHWKDSRRAPDHYASWSPEAARFLVEGRSIFALGTDAPALDFGGDVTHYLAEHNAYGLTNVANLGQAPHSGAVLVVAPARVQSSPSGPVRVLALIRIPMNGAAPAL